MDIFTASEPAAAAASTVGGGSLNSMHGTMQLHERTLRLALMAAAAAALPGAEAAVAAAAVAEPTPNHVNEGSQAAPESSNCHREQHQVEKPECLNVEPSYGMKQGEDQQHLLQAGPSSLPLAPCPFGSDLSSLGSMPSWMQQQQQQQQLSLQQRQQQQQQAASSSGNAQAQLNGMFSQPRPFYSPAPPGPSSLQHTPNPTAPSNNNSSNMLGLSAFASSSLQANVPLAASHQMQYSQQQIAQAQQNAIIQQQNQQQRLQQQQPQQQQQWAQMQAMQQQQAQAMQQQQLQWMQQQQQMQMQGRPIMSSALLGAQTTASSALLGTLDNGARIAAMRFMQQQQQQQQQRN